MNLFSSVTFGTDFLGEFFTYIVIFSLMAMFFDYTRGAK